MIVYLILQGLDSILFFIVSLLPNLETPLWLTTTMPQILRVIYGFNIYLPVSEAFTAVFMCIGFTLLMRVFSIVASLVHLSI